MEGSVTTAASVSLYALLALGVGGLLSGAISLWFGLWPRRRGDVPHCRRCDYNLTGIESARCPECGSELSAETIVHGERRRRPWLIAVGLTAVAAGLASFALAARHVDWYRFTPTSWVLADVRSPVANTAAKAWRELRRRESAGRLSAAQRSKLIDACLAEQASTRRIVMTSRALDYLAECYVKGRLSDKQATTFFRQMPVLKLEVRKRVVQGDPVPLQVTQEVRCPDSLLWVRMGGVSPILIDGKPAGHRSGFVGGIGGLSSKSTIGFQVSWNDLGNHTVKVAWPLAVYHGPKGDPEGSRLCRKMEIPLEATFEVVEAGSDGVVKLIKDASLRPRLQDAIQPLRFFTTQGLPGQVQYELQVFSLPVNVAFDVIARVKGEEHSLGAITMRQGGATKYSSDAELPPADTFDLILRASDYWARRTVDLYEIWDGELVYENVSIESKRRRLRLDAP